MDETKADEPQSVVPESTTTTAFDGDNIHVLPKYALPILAGQNDICSEEAETDNTECDQGPEHNGGTYCTFLLQGKQCLKKSCPHYHDLKEYLQHRPRDLPMPCPFYETYGKCPYGVNCRFGRDHVDPVTGENRLKPNFIDPPALLNTVSNSEMSVIRKLKGSITEENFSSFETTSLAASGKATLKASVNDIDDEISKDINANKNILKSYFECYNKGKHPERMFCLAPMCTVGTLPFRRLCAALYFRATGKRLGTCSEMIFARNFLKGDKFEVSRIKRHPDERIFGIQICTNNSAEYGNIFRYLATTNKCNFVDLNAACPQDVAVKCGFGAKLIERTSQLRHIICSGKLWEDKAKNPAVAATIKIRIGDFEGNLKGEEIVQKLAESSAAIDGLFVHGRTARQRYAQTADWEYLGKCRESFEKVFPNATFGCNGDVFGPEDLHGFIDYNKNTLVTESLGDNTSEKKNSMFILVGRGALIKPWIFEELETGKRIDKTAEERMEILNEFARYLLEFYGTDDYGVEKARINFLENYSFLCRYTPHGILEEEFPQKMNQRYVPYKGRSKLESLLGSQRIEDWIKVSEKLFGRVPQGFSFVPKHKSRSY